MRDLLDNILFLFEGGFQRRICFIAVGSSGPDYDVGDQLVFTNGYFFWREE